MAIMGLRGTGDWGTDERPKNFRETILWRQPNGMAPLTALMAKMGSEKTDDPEFAWWEEQLNAHRLQVNGALTNVATALVVDSGDATNLVPGDLLLVEKADQTTYDNEIVEVTAVASSTAATISRGAAGTTAAAIPDDAFLTKIGNVYSEGSGSPSASTRNPTKSFNYCQIFKTAYELTESAKVTKSRTGDPLKNDKKRKMFDHSVAMEMAFLFGRKWEGTGSNGKPKRTTGGLRSFLSTNVTVFGGGGPAFSMDNFVNAISPVFDYATGAGDERLGLIGNTALTALNRLAQNTTNTRINHTEMVKVYGMNLTRVVMPQGTLYLKSHPLMNVHPLFTKSMFVLNPSGVKYRYLRDTKPQDNIQGNDSDTEKGQWIGECGMEVHHERTFAYLGNMA
jgi:hypothetical protein